MKPLVVLAALAVAGCQPRAYQATIRPAPVSTEQVTASAPVDPAVEALVAPYRQQVEAQMHEVLGTAPVAINKNNGESPLGNFVSDLLRARASAALQQPIDLGVMTNGGMRVGIPAGKITVGDIFELMPFENELVVLDAPGPVVYQLFQYAAPIGMAVSGASFRVSTAKKPVDIRIGGQPFDSTRTYSIAISDYLAGGGDYLTFFRPLKPRDTGVLVRSAITDHLRQLTAQHQPATAKVENRVTF